MRYAVSVEKNSAGILPLHLFSWLLVGSIFVMWTYGFEEAAYKYGKLVVAFLAGMQAGAVV